MTEEIVLSLSNLLAAMRDNQSLFVELFVLKIVFVVAVWIVAGLPEDSRR
jgi:hypothetical protein